MRYLSITISLVLSPGALSLTVGCTSPNPRPDYERTARLVEEATANTTLYRPSESSRVAEQVEQLLQGGLTIDDAARVYLLNNRRLQAALHELRAVRADLVQASLLSNPSLAMGLTLPDGGGLANLQVALAQNLADLWLLPPRKQAAERRLDRTILQVAHEAAAGVAETKTAYYRAKQAERAREIAEESRTIAQQVLDLAIARQQAGAGSEVDVNLTRSEVLDAELALRAADLTFFEARSALATMLSLTISPDALKLPDPLPEPSTWPTDEQALIGLAESSRLDLRAAEAACVSAAARIREEQAKVFPVFELGVSFEREERRPGKGRNILADSAKATAAEGKTRFEIAEKEKPETNTLIGPTIGMELPIFNQNQGGIARAGEEYEQIRRSWEDLRVQVHQQVRVAAKRVQTAREYVSFYRERALPLRETSLDLARTAYQAGRTTLLSVLEAERALLAARSGHAEALLASAAAVVELEKATGRPIAGIIEATRSQASAPEAGADPAPLGPTSEPITE